MTSGRRRQGGALAPTLWPSTAWEVGTADELRRASVRPRAADFYARHANPSVTAFEEAVAELEGAEAALAFASGMGALSAVVLGLCSSGDHVVAQQQLYSGTQLLLAAVCPRFGIEVTFVDGTEPGAFAAAVRPGRTMLVVAETPANPALAVVDLEELGAIRGPFTVVDSTFATPLGQRPLDFGASLVLHSATKGLSGHNDASLGVVCGERDLVDQLWSFAVLHGANASPFDAVNGLRGLRTLGVRLARQTSSALALAAWLEGRPEVACVRHPGLASHPQHELARRQMRSPGSMVAVDLGGFEAARSFVDALSLCRVAASLGGPETLVSHPASSTHVNLTPEERAAGGVGEGLVRISVGLEHPDDLRADLERALEGVPTRA